MPCCRHACPLTRGAKGPPHHMCAKCSGSSLQGLAAGQNLLPRDAITAQVHTCVICSGTSLKGLAAGQTSVTHAYMLTRGAKGTTSQVHPRHMQRHKYTRVICSGTSSQGLAAGQSAVTHAGMAARTKRHPTRQCCWAARAHASTSSADLQQLAEVCQAEALLGRLPDAVVHCICCAEVLVLRVAALGDDAHHARCLGCLHADTAVFNHHTPGRGRQAGIL
ncbi:hypothetical protein COO60DRAFT_259335 [Scenedesmus sp. NREL 46B-D3]|nr:hypothetical protein COO60DRAFT_259335 [Scenedesmus sp. NREL 46B-D3]